MNNTISSHGKCPFLANNDNAWNGVKSFFAQDIKYVISTLNPYLPFKKEVMSPHFYVMKYLLTLNNKMEPQNLIYSTDQQKNHVTNATDKFH